MRMADERGEFGVAIFGLFEQSFQIAHRSSDGVRLDAAGHSQ
jgi:hypothetical protein